MEDCKTSKRAEMDIATDIRPSAPQEVQLPPLVVAKIGEYLEKKDRIRLERVCRAFRLGLRHSRAWASLTEVDFTEFLSVQPVHCDLCQEEWAEMMVLKRNAHRSQGFASGPTDPPKATFANEDSIVEIVQGVLSRTSSVNLRSLALVAPGTAVLSQRRTRDFLRCLADADAPLHFPSRLQRLRLSGLDFSAEAFASLEKLLGRVAASLHCLEFPEGVVPRGLHSENVHNRYADCEPNYENMSKYENKLREEGKDEALQRILSRTVPNLRKFTYSYQEHTRMFLDFLHEKKSLEAIDITTNALDSGVGLNDHGPKEEQWLYQIEHRKLIKFWLRLKDDLDDYSGHVVKELFKPGCPMRETLQFFHLEIEQAMCPTWGLDSFNMVKDFKHLKTLSLATGLLVLNVVAMLTKSLTRLEAFFVYKCRGFDDECVGVVGANAPRLRRFGVCNFEEEHEDGEFQQVSASIFQALKDLQAKLDLDRVYVSEKMLLEGAFQGRKFRVGWDERGRLPPEIDDKI